MSYSIRLKPCPFCGYHEPRMEREGMCDFYCYVRCPSCGAKTPSEYTEEDAARTWNKRRH